MLPLISATGCLTGFLLFGDFVLTTRKDRAEELYFSKAELNL